MKCTVIGMAISSFVNRSTGELVDNSKLYVTCPHPRNPYGDVQCYGMRCLEVRIPTPDLEGVEVGSIVSLSFDNKGKYDELEILSTPAPAKPSGGNADKSTGGK